MIKYKIYTELGILDNLIYVYLRLEDGLWLDRCKLVIDSCDGGYKGWK